MNANRVKPNANVRPKLFRRVDLLRRAVPTPLRTFPIASAIIVASVLLNFIYLVWFCPLDLSPDEAHYWDWSRRLDWSYYSKGPLIAWIIRASCELCGNYDRTLAVRLPAIGFHGLLLLALYRLAQRTLQSERLALSVLLLSLTLPPLSVGAVLMTIDSPYLCAWAWAAVCVHRAIFDGSRAAWRWAGVILAVGILAKYTMVIFPVCVGLYLIVDRERRKRLLTRGFASMCGIGLLGFVPIVIWNLLNDGIGVRHVFTQTGLATGPKIGFKPFGPLDYIAGQFGFLIGYWFCASAAAAWAFRPWRSRNPQFEYLWWLSVPVVLVLIPVSFRVTVQPNWPAAAHLCGFLLAVAWVSQQLESDNLRYRRFVRACLAFAVLLGIAISLFVHFPTMAVTYFAQIAGEPSEFRAAPVRNLDPTARLRGWRYLASHIDIIRERVKAEDGESPQIAAMIWTVPGELAHYCKGNPQVFSFGSALDDRRSQYDIWRPNPVADAQVYRGRTFLYVGEKMPEMDAIFETIESPNRVVYRENGVIVGEWTVWVGRGFRGFPATTAKPKY